MLLAVVFVAGVTVAAAAEDERPAPSTNGGSYDKGSGTATVPDRPTGVTAVFSDGGVLVDWDPDTSVDSWNVLRKFRPAESSFTVVAVVDGSLSQWTDTDLTEGDRRYKVVAVRDSLQSRRSTTAKLIVATTVRPAPGTITQVVDKPVQKPITLSQVSDSDCPGSVPSNRVLVLGESKDLGQRNSRTWLGVTLQANETYQIDAISNSGNASQKPTIVGVCDPNDAAIADTDSMIEEGMISKYSLLVFTTKVAGEHYIAVKGGSSTEGQELNVLVTDLSDDLCSEDTDTDCSVSAGQKTSGKFNTPTDDDWVSVQLTAGTSYQFDLSSGRDPWIQNIYDNNGNQITRPAESFVWTEYNGYFDRNSGPGASARVVYTATRTGAHYIEVGASGAWYQRRGNWKLRMTELAAGALPYDDYAASSATTGTVSVGGSATGNIGETPLWYDAGDNISLDRNTADVDWFAVDLTANRSYALDLAAPGATWDVRRIAGVYDDDGDLIPGTAARQPSTFTPQTTAKYFVAVAGDTSNCSGTHGCNGRYTLSVTEQ